MYQAKLSDIILKLRCHTKVCNYFSTFVLARFLELTFQFVR